MEVRLIEQFECVLHFPKLPYCMEGFRFLPVDVEIKPKISGGDEY